MNIPKCIVYLSPTKRMRTSSRALQPPLPCPTILATVSHKTTCPLQMHTVEKPYYCNLCDYALSRTYTLKTHLKAHSREKRNKAPTIITLFPHNRASATCCYRLTLLITPWISIKSRRTLESGSKHKKPWDFAGGLARTATLQVILGKSCLLFTTQCRLRWIKDCENHGETSSKQQTCIGKHVSPSPPSPPLSLYWVNEPFYSKLITQIGKAIMTIKRDV